MAQRLKEEVRDRILAAAGEAFATHGYDAARLADIAAQAGTSASNLYKYYDGKAALFDAVVTPKRVEAFRRVLRARIDELALRPDWSQADAGGSSRARELLETWIEQRWLAVILMRGAQGTGYAHVRRELIDEMTRRALRSREAGSRRSAELRFVLRQIFERTLDTLSAILVEHDDPDAIRRAVGHFWRYQLAGLQALVRNA